MTQAVTEKVPFCQERARAVDNSQLWSQTCMDLGPSFTTTSSVALDKFLSKGR